MRVRRGRLSWLAYPNAGHHLAGLASQRDLTVRSMGCRILGKPIPIEIDDVEALASQGRGKAAGIERAVYR